MLISRAKRLAGVLAFDLPVYLGGFARGPRGYLRIRNRLERLESSVDGEGYRCQWQWTTELHAPKLVPELARALVRRALADHPVMRAASPVSAGAPPQVSFLIGHKGSARLALLLATLESIAAQTDARIECIVVEQDATAQLAAHLPAWVRLVHAPAPSGEMPFCRSWAFNIASNHARAPVLVLHDNDMLVPADYASEILRRIGQGYDVVNLKRFIFYLTQPHTAAYLDGGAALAAAAPEAVVQNLEAGGSVAITREGFERIGGMDESFVGWGGEDNDLWDRAQVLRVWPWASLSLIHLFHTAQAGKHDAAFQTARHYRALSQLDPATRIARLKALRRGRMEGPAGWNSAGAHSHEHDHEHATR